MTYIDIASVANRLGKAQRYGKQWQCCCPAHDDRNPSLSVRWDAQSHRLLVHCFAGCSGDAVLNALKKQGLLPDREFSNYTSHSPKPAKAPKVEIDEKVKYATKLWNESVTAEGSLTETYLKERSYYGPIPPTIRFHQRLYHGESKTYHPAMVAMVNLCPSNDLEGIHRTYLRDDGSGKALVEPNKMMLGYIKGGAVRLSPPGAHLYLTEGIETGLSVFLATGMTTWAALSTSGLVNVQVPPVSITQEITIAADNDPPGRQAAETLAQRLGQAGYKIYISIPSKGMDFNDVLRRK